MNSSEYLKDGNLYHLHVTVGITNKPIETFDNPKFKIDGVEHELPIQHIPFLYSKETYEKLRKDIAAYVNKFFEELQTDGSL